MTSVLKLPFLTSIAWGMHVSMSPPNSLEVHKSSGPSESSQSTSEDILKWSAHGAVKVVTSCHVLTRSLNLKPQAGWCVLSALEIVTICAHAFMHSAPGSRVLELLSLQRSGSGNLRMTWPFIVGWMMNLSGTLLRIKCYQTLGSLFTFQLTIRPEHKLVTTGPYAYVRHPSYTGAVGAAVGTLLCYTVKGSWLRECSGYLDDERRLWGMWMIFMGVLLSTFVSRMKKEDRLLQGKFGAQWDEWRAQVPWRLIPGIW
jgi:protein-S-isoprenylcysteine O-methyltransferase Ste14